MGFIGNLLKKLKKKGGEFLGGLIGGARKLAGGAAKRIGGAIGGAAKALPAAAGFVANKIAQNPVMMLGPSALAGQKAVSALHSMLPKHQGGPEHIKPGQDYNEVADGEAGRVKMPLEYILGGLGSGIRSVGRKIGPLLENEGAIKKGEPTVGVRLMSALTGAPMVETIQDSEVVSPEVRRRAERAKAELAQKDDSLKTKALAGVEAGLNFVPVTRGGAAVAKGLLGASGRIGAKNTAKAMAGEALATAPLGIPSHLARSAATGQDASVKGAALDTAAFAAGGAAGPLLGAGARQLRGLVKARPGVRIVPKGRPVTVDRAAADVLQGIPKDQGRKAVKSIRKTGTVTVQPTEIISEFRPSRLQQGLTKLAGRTADAQPVSSRPGIKIVDPETVTPDVIAQKPNRGVDISEEEPPQALMPAEPEAVKVQPAGTTEVGVTPFRGKPFKKTKELSPYYETTRAKGFMSDVEDLHAAKEIPVRVQEIQPTAGVWEGDLEPSFGLKLEGDQAYVRSAAATLGKKYNQDAVALFSPATGGPGRKYTLRGVGDVDRAVSMLRRHGISGATAEGEHLVIYDMDNSLRAGILSLAKDLGTKASVRRGNIEFLESGAYDEAIQAVSPEAIDGGGVPAPEASGSSATPGRPDLPEDAGPAPTEPEPRFEEVEQAILSKQDAEAAARKMKDQSLKDRFFTSIVDYLYPVEKELNRLRTGAHGSIPGVRPSMDPSPQFDKVMRAKSIANQFIKDNGLYDIVQGVSAKDNAALDQYLKARRHVGPDGSMGQGTLRAREKTTGRDVLEDQRIVKVYGPQFEETAQRVTQYSQDLLDMAATPLGQEFVTKSGARYPGLGLLTPDAARYLKKIDPYHVPYDRIFAEAERSGGRLGTKAVASLAEQTVAQRMKGSTREIEPVLESLILKTAQVIEQGEKNRAAWMMGELADNPGMAGLIRRLDEGEVAPAHGFSYLDNGEKVSFETTKEIEESVKRLRVEEMGILGRIMAAPTRIFKVGTTGLEPSFVLTNLVRDQGFAFITSRAGLRSSAANPEVFGKALFAATGHGDLYEQMVREGSLQTFFDTTRNQQVQSVRRIRAERNPVTKYGRIVTRPGELFRAIEDAVGSTEMLTRAQQRLGTYGKFMKDLNDGKLPKGWTEEDVKVLAAQAARENTANFNRLGSWGPAVRAAWAYLNAGIQGSRALIRGFQRRPVAFTFKVATSLYMPVAWATMFNLSTEERRKAYADIPEFEKQNNIMILLNPKQQEDGRWTGVLKIPVTPGLNSLADIVRKPIEMAADMNQSSPWEMFSRATGVAIPIDIGSPNKALASLMPQALKPAVEDITNMDTFTGRPIVSDSQLEKPTEEQFSTTTSGVAINIGKILDKSPLKVDHLIRSQFGKLGLEIAHVADLALEKTGYGPQVGGISPKEAISERFISATGTPDFIKEYKANQELLNKLSPKQQKGYQFLKEFEELPADTEREKIMKGKSKAAVLLQDDELRGVFAEVKRKQKEHDPLYDLNDAKMTQVLLARYLPPGSDKYGYKKAMYAQQWYKDFQKKTTAYFDKLKSKKKEDFDLEGKLKTFNKLDGKAKERYLAQNKDVAEFQKTKDQPFIQPDNDRPQATPELQAKLDYYNTLPSGTGARSAFITANPDVENFFNTSKEFTNSQLAAVGLISSPDAEYDGSGGYGGYKRYGRRGGGGGRGGRGGSGSALDDSELAQGIRTTRRGTYKTKKPQKIKIRSRKTVRQPALRPIRTPRPLAIKIKKA